MPAAKRRAGAVLAVVDVGSNSVRLQIGHAAADGTLTVLGEDKAPVRLGEQVFRTGRLAPDAITRAAVALHRFAELSRRAGAQTVRAVATSAVREASNRALLLRTVRQQAGLELEVISGAEEARLICLGVLQGAPPGERKLLCDIGGGSTEITAARGEEPEASYSLQLGSVRLTEFFIEHDPITRKEARLVDEAVQDALGEVDGLLVGKFKRMMGSAGTISAVMALVRAPSSSRAPLRAPSIGKPGLVTREQVELALERLRGTNSKERRRLGVEEHRADIVYAGAAILAGVMRKLRVEEVETTSRGLRDGLMVDLIRRVVKPPGAGLHQEHAVVEGLRAFGRRCGYREEHAEQVAQLSLSLFDQTREVHRLGEEERALLNAAAMLHDVGAFVSYNRHHKHSYYLLYHADLPGFTDRERALIATIARYHRRSPPKDRHEIFQLLAPEERIIVRRLAAILRVADGLDRGHKRNVRSLKIQKRQRGLVVDVFSEEGGELEIWAAQQKAELLAEVAGGPISFRLHRV